MNESAGIVDVPSIDLPHYIGIVFDFITQNYHIFFDFIKNILALFITISIPLSLFFIIGIVVAVEGIKTIRKEEKKIYDPPKDEKGEDNSVIIHNNLDANIAKRWDEVKKHISSTNENDWRQAIMEADIILDQILIKLGYTGESIGERLKRVPKGDMQNLNKAWEAHIVRNEIAHEGSSVSLNHEKAKQIIGLYRQVFEEFYHIKE